MKNILWYRIIIALQLIVFISIFLPVIPGGYDCSEDSGPEQITSLYEIGQSRYMYSTSDILQQGRYSRDPDNGVTYACEKVPFDAQQAVDIGQGYVFVDNSVRFGTKKLFEGKKGTIHSFRTFDEEVLISHEGTGISIQTEIAIKKNICRVNVLYNNTYRCHTYHMNNA